MKKNTLWKLSALGMLAFTAACGGEKKAEQPATGETTGAATTAPTESAAPAPEAVGATVTPDPGGKVIDVHMKTTQGGASGVYEPADFTAKKGDVIRFINDGGAAHNVNFQIDQNAGNASLPGSSPYLTGAGQTWEMKVDMDAGTYPYHCDPHAVTGMKGVMTVTQ